MASPIGDGGAKKTGGSSAPKKVAPPKTPAATSGVSAPKKAAVADKASVSTVNSGKSLGGKMGIDTDKLSGVEGAVVSSSRTLASDTSGGGSATPGIVS